MINFGKSKDTEEEKTPEQNHPITSGIKFGIKPNKADTPYDNVEVTKTVNENHPTVKPKGLFHTEKDTIAENITNIIVEKYPQFDDVRKIKNMVRHLIDHDLSVVTGWGESFLAEQRHLISNASSRIREFNSLNGTQLLTEILDFSKQNHNMSFFQKLTTKFSNIETYNNSVASLKMQMNSIFPLLCEYKNQCKTNQLSLYLAIISVVDDNEQDKEKLLADAFYNRRILLTGALKNLEMLSIQLDQTLESVSGLLNEVSHIMDVVLPALKMRNS